MPGSRETLRKLNAARQQLANHRAQAAERSKMLAGVVSKLAIAIATAQAGGT